MNLSFRQATQDDCEALASLVNEAYRGESSASGWTTESHLLGGLRTDTQMLEGLVDRPVSQFLMAFDEGSKLVGCVHLEKRSEQDCYLGMLTVRPSGQTQGVGKSLLAQAENFARQIYLSKRMEMTVITVRHELLAWYERRGYRRTGRLIPFPVDPRFGLLKVESLEMEVLEKILG